MTSRICTTNNRFKRSKKKVVFLREFLLANKKHSQFFWGQYTVHTGNRSLVSSDWQNGFSHEYQKKLIPKEKGMTPYWPPVPTNHKNVITGVETPWNFIYNVLKENIKSIEFHIAQRFPHPSHDTKDARSIHALCERPWNVNNLSFGWESFPKLLVLLDKMHTGKKNNIVRQNSQSEVNLGSYEDRADPCQLG